MRLLLILALLFPGTPGTNAPDELRDLLYESDTARAAQDLKRERRALERATKVKGDPEDLARAELRLAEIEWKFDQDHEAARERLLRATTGVEPALAWKGVARMEFAGKRYAAAHEAASRVAELGATDELQLWGQVSRARATIAASEAARRAGQPEGEAIGNAIEELQLIVVEHRGLLAPARALVRGATLARDAEALRLGWESYYHIDASGQGPNAIDIPGMRRALARWPVSTLEFVDLIVALSDSRLFDEAELVALDPRAPQEVSDDARVHEITAYARTLDELSREIPEYYRRLSLGKRDNRRLDRLLSQAWKNFARELSDTRSSEVKAFVEERFGAHWTIGQTGGFYGIHFGHIVSDETRHVTQYDQEGQLRFARLDSMVSNGFPGWDLEGGGSSGGWAGPDEMWQVRPGYAGVGVRAWVLLRDPNALLEFEEQIARATAGDDDLARDDPHAYLPGLAGRLQFQGVSRLYARIVADGLEGPALREAFIEAFESAVLESSIYAHEGRHAIDAHLKKSGYPAPNSEFTAKLSEVAFAPEPRMGLGAIFTSNIGARSTHGVANAAIMKGVVKWMQAHRDQIEGFDGERPTLPQFDLLTDEQIRTAFRSMDPLARGH